MVHYLVYQKRHSVQIDCADRQLLPIGLAALPFQAILVRSMYLADGDRDRDVRAMAQHTLYALTTSSIKPL